MKGVSAIILAAGKGKRMKSALPKVAHPALGKPLVWHVAAAARAAGIRDMVFVLGFGRDKVLPTVEGFGGRVADPGKPVRDRGCRPVRPEGASRIGEGGRGPLRGRAAPAPLHDPGAARDPPPEGGRGLRPDRHPRRSLGIRPDRPRSRRHRRTDRGREGRGRRHPGDPGGELRYVRLRPGLPRGGAAAPDRRERPEGVLPDRPRPGGARRGEARGAAGGGRPRRGPGNQLAARAGGSHLDPPVEEAGRRSWTPA